MAVVGAAAGYMLSDLAGIPFSASATLVMAIVGILYFFGRRVIEAARYGTVAWVLFAAYFSPIATIGLLGLLKPLWKKSLD